jgi:pimeloyl-ACP methyl ester carboxylesterase
VNQATLDKLQRAVALLRSPDGQGYGRFCQLVRIRPKEGGLATYAPRHIQHEVHRTATPVGARVKVTKARQMGITTDLCISALHYALFNPSVKVGIAAQHSKTAQEIFGIVRTAYDNLPPWLRKAPPFRERKNSSTTLAFANGSAILVGTANSAFWRGQTFQRMLLTEAAFYNSLKDTITAVAQVVPDDGQIVLETTANGPNDWQDFWTQDNGYIPLFFAWTSDESYVSNDPLPDDLNPIEEDYIAVNNLPLPRASWYVKTLRQKCFGNQQVFDQEYPISATVAFITSGSKFFPATYQVGPDVTALGWRIYAPYKPGHKYTIGVDPSGGSPTGDYGCAVVLDVTNPSDWQEVATYVGRDEPAALAAQVAIQAQAYHALVNPESNNHGTALIDGLKPYGLDLYRQSSHSATGNMTFARQYGTEVTATSRPLILMRLYRALVAGALTVNDDRTKSHLNNFVYSASGKPQASTGKHDDCVFALAHAVGAAHSARTWTAAQAPMPPPPDLGLGIAARMKYEQDTGHVLTSNDYEDYDSLF